MAGFSGLATAIVKSSIKRAASCRKALAALAFVVLASAAARADFAAGLEAYDAGDYGAAVAAWRPLAEAGDAEAQVALAELYLHGQGVVADAEQAVAWYRRAAEQGDAVAQLNLGDLYRWGRGLPRDLVHAYVWLALAARQGRRWAAGQRDEIAQQLDPARLSEARRLLDRGMPAD